MAADPWVYLDTSIALAQLLGESGAPASSLWRRRLIASRLLEYETWTRLHGMGLSLSHGEVARELLAAVAFVELRPNVLGRIIDGFTPPLRTLDAIHLATALHLRDLGHTVELASLDARLCRAADHAGIPAWRGD